MALQRRANGHPRFPQAHCISSRRRCQLSPIWGEEHQIDACVVAPLFNECRLIAQVLFWPTKLRFTGGIHLAILILRTDSVIQYSGRSHEPDPFRVPQSVGTSSRSGRGVGDLGS